MTDLSISGRELPNLRAEWDSPMFDLAKQQLIGAAAVMGLDDNIRDRLLYPQRTLIVSFPFRRDNYERVDTMFGYRVQHVLTMGPTKGGVRVDPGTLSKREIQRLTRRYTMEIIGMIGPDKDIPARRHGHQRAHDGVDDGHLQPASRLCGSRGRHR